MVRCPFCESEFDLFAAAWCGHTRTHPSKTCSHCGRCVCQHPTYRAPRLWVEAPAAFQRQGFERLFILYL